jgi:organic radical activating enzyme
MPLKWFVKRMFIKFIPFWFLMLMRNLIFRNKKTRPRDLLKFEVHLADHCNLNCIGCNNFSPIAEPYLLDVESFRKDCERISKLAGRKIGDLFLLGGEPLLHPHINEILIIVGQSFDIYNASIVTNGILLLKMTEDFWKCCKENRIKIIITKYPINLNFEAIENIAENHGVRLEYFGKTGEELKEMVLVPLDLEGRQNITQRYI